MSALATSGGDHVCTRRYLSAGQAHQAAAERREPADVGERHEHLARGTHRDPPLAAELGVLAFGRAYAAWSQADGVAEDDLAQYALTALAELRAATASLG